MPSSAKPVPNHVSKTNPALSKRKWLGPKPRSERCRCGHAEADHHASQVGAPCYFRQYLRDEPCPCTTFISAIAPAAQ